MAHRRYETIEGEGKGKCGAKLAPEEAFPPRTAAHLAELLPAPVYPGHSLARLLFTGSTLGSVLDQPGCASI